MRIAVLLYGQPRFFNITWKRIKEEFSLPGYTFDFFIHFWEQIGFCPECDKTENYIIDDSISQYIENIGAVIWAVTNYNELDTLNSSFKNTLAFLKNGKIQYKKYDSRSRYSFGQHLSLKKAYKLMVKHEEKFNFKYDIVIKARSDYVYRDLSFYKNEEDYNKNKKEHYIIPNHSLKSKYIHVTSLAKQVYNPEKDCLDFTTLLRYDPTYKIGIKEDLTSLIMNRDVNNTMRHDDISVCCSRSAAEFYFNRWFETYIKTFMYDYYHNLQGIIKSHSRHDTLQGDISLYNDIYVKKLPVRRYKRIVIKEKVKEKWLKDCIPIDINDCNYEQQICKVFKKKLK